MNGFRFRKSFQLLPGVRLNISKTGTSLTVGPKGASVTMGKQGTFLNLDLPGSGMYYRKKIGEGKAENGSKKHEAKQDEPQIPEKLDVGFLGKITTPMDELQFVEALKALLLEEHDRAFEHAKNASHLPDGAFLAGFLAFQRGQFDTAAKYFRRALEAPDLLGKHAEKYEVDLSVDLPITEDVHTRIPPSYAGALLALAQCYEFLGMKAEMITAMQTLHERDPHDLVIRLGLVEALADAYPNDEAIQRRIVALAEDVHNASPIHAALMYYRARALRQLGLIEGAKDTLTKALRRKKDYPHDLLRALRYERAVISEMTGDSATANKEYQKIYAEAPTYEDVAARLGL
jgi:tetratricopeptide (TPR) repeat protein